MGNMSYCMYQNTLSDLNDCFEDMKTREEESIINTIDGSYMVDSGGDYEYEDSLSMGEKRAQKRLVNLCKKVVELAEETNFVTT